MLDFEVGKQKVGCWIWRKGRRGAWRCIGRRGMQVCGRAEHERKILCMHVRGRH
jgi:hypothetical protein